MIFCINNRPSQYLDMRNKVTFNTTLKTAEYFLGQSGPIKIEIARVLGIGEFRTSGGPMPDDYYLVLFAPQMWFAIPMDADGITDFIQWLEVEFNTDIKTDLPNGVTEKSKMIYPKQLRGKEFIKAEKYIPKNWFDAVRVSFGLKPGKILKLHTDISEMLKTGT